MQADSKHKRKTAGFIRTNSSKALPTFKIPNHSQSSDDFSSFEDSPNPQRNRHPQQSDSEFSPYKNAGSAQAKIKQRPLLPPAGNVRMEGEGRQRDGRAAGKADMFSNEKLRRNYETNSFGESPGKIVNRSNRSSRIVQDREEQIRETLRKRVEVEKELAQIDRICQDIEKIKVPQHFKQQSSQRNGKESDERTKSAAKQRQQEANNKPSFSLEKQQYKIPKPPTNPTAGTQNKNFLNRQPHYKAPQKTQNHLNNPQPQNYNFEQSQISQDEEDEEDYSGFHYEQTFKPNAGEQILTSIEQYRKMHPEIEEKRRNNNNSSNEKRRVIQSNSHHGYNEDKIRSEHEKARKKFIHEPQQQNQVQQQQQERQEQISQEEDSAQVLIPQYPTQQFKKTTLRQTVQAQRQLTANSPTFGKTSNHNNNINRLVGGTKTIQNSSGIYKAKGGICFDLDINQFTQYESNPTHQQQQRQTTYVAKKNKKVNAKQEILKRRQMAKNYDKLARAKVFSGY